MVRTRYAQHTVRFGGGVYLPDLKMDTHPLRLAQDGLCFLIYYLAAYNMSQSLIRKVGLW
jgi:hypothetical protein